MAAAADHSIEEEYQVLSARQRLKAAMHYTALKICQETEDKYGMTVNQQAVAAISETVWKQTESFAVDLELFAKHGKRSVINADDVKLLIRRNPYLLRHIQDVHVEHTQGREPTKKRGRKKKAATGEATTDQDADGQMEADDDEQSNL